MSLPTRLAGRPVPPSLSSLSSLSSLGSAAPLPASGSTDTVVPTPGPTSSLTSVPLAGAVLVATLLLAACGGGGDSTAPAAATPPPVTGSPPASGPPAQTLPVSIAFAAKAGQADVRCGSPIAALGTGATAAELRDLRFYVSEVALVTDQEVAVPVVLTPSTWQTDSVALIDLEDATGACAEAGTALTHATIEGTVAAGTYTGVRFTVGVPAALNHSDYAVATAPMDVQAMAWSWQAGRKFLQIEVDPAGGLARPAPAAPAKSFYAHLGSTGCVGNPVTGETVSCARSNRMAFHSHGFDQASQRIIVDLATLLATSNLAADGGGAPGCMSGSTDPECAPIFSALKIDLESGQSIDDGHGQTLFRVEAK